MAARQCPSCDVGCQAGCKFDFKKTKAASAIVPRRDLLMADVANGPEENEGGGGRNVEDGQKEDEIALEIDITQVATQLAQEDGAADSKEKQGGDEEAKVMLKGGDIDMKEDEEEIEETPRVRVRKAGAVPPGKRVCPSATCDAQIWIRVSKCPVCSFVIPKSTKKKKKSTSVRRLGAPPPGKRVCPSPGDSCTAIIGTRTRVCPECQFVVIFGPSTEVHKVTKAVVDRTEDADISVDIGMAEDDDEEEHIEDAAQRVRPTRSAALPRGKRICPADACDAQIAISASQCPVCDHTLRRATKTNRKTGTLPSRKKRKPQYTMNRI